MANIFRLLAVRLLPDRVDAKNLSLAIQCTDTHQDWLVEIGNSVLNAWPGRTSEQPDVVLKADEMNIKRLFLGLASATELIEKQTLSASGDVAALAEFASWFTTFARRFPIVTPRVDD